jgi:hypothetical protein
MDMPGEEQKRRRSAIEDELKRKFKEGSRIRTPMLVDVNEGLLRSLPRLLGQADLSDLACKRTGRCIRLVVHCAPQHKQIMFAELESELHK